MYSANHGKAYRVESITELQIVCQTHIRTCSHTAHAIDQAKVLPHGATTPYAKVDVHVQGHV